MEAERNSTCILVLVVLHVVGHQESSQLIWFCHAGSGASLISILVSLIFLRSSCVRGARSSDFHLIFISSLCL